MNSSSLNESHNPSKNSFNLYQRKKQAPISIINCGNSVLYSKKSGNIGVSYIEDCQKNQGKLTTREQDTNINSDRSYKVSNRATNGFNKTTSNQIVNPPVYNSIWDTKSTHVTTNSLGTNKSNMFKRSKHILYSKMKLTKNTIAHRDFSRNNQKKYKYTYSIATQEEYSRSKAELQSKLNNASKRKNTTIIPSNSIVDPSKLIAPSKIHFDKNNNATLSTGNAITLPTESDYNDYFIISTKEEKNPKKKLEIKTEDLVIFAKDKDEIKKEKEKEQATLCFRNPKVTMQIQKQTKKPKIEICLDLFHKKNSTKLEQRVNIEINEEKKERPEKNIKKIDMKKLVQITENTRNMNLVQYPPFELNSLLKDDIVNNKDINKSDSFDDMNTIIRKINFKKVNRKSDDIFASDNDIYQAFSNKFNENFDKFVVNSKK